MSCLKVYQQLPFTILLIYVPTIIMSKFFPIFLSFLKEISDTSSDHTSVELNADELEGKS